MVSRTPVAIVGAGSLLGRELRELISERKLPFGTHLFSGDPDQASGTFAVADEEGEATFFEPLTAAKLAGVPVILLAGSDESSRRTLEHAPKTSTILDLTGALEDSPGAQIVAPDAALPFQSAGAQSSRRRVVAHSAAIALDLLLSRAARASAIRQIVTTAFEPASARGQAGVNELQKQTTALLAFQKVPKTVFDAQAAFNLLPEYGEEAPFALDMAEATIHRHFASLASRRKPGYPALSLRLVQAPVFHGYSFQLWIEFDSAVGQDVLLAALADPRIDLRTAGVEPPTNVGAAQQSGITAGSFRQDANNPRAWWIWAVCDNLRLAAESALELVQEAVHA